MTYLKGDRFCLIALYLLLVFAQIYHATNYPVRYDDAHFANVIKSLANGHGYEAVFLNKLTLFHPAITTGPVLIFPAALMVDIFGNKCWVINITSVIIINLLLLLNYSFLRRFYSKKIDVDKFAFLFLLLSVAGSMSFYNSEHFNAFPLWYLLMGEIPGALLSISAVMLLFTGTLSKNMFRAGIVIGLAVLCKLIYMFVFFGVIVQFAFQKKFKEILIVGSGLLLPVLCFELYKVISVGGFKAYYDHVVFFSKFFTLRGFSDQGFLPSTYMEHFLLRVDKLRLHFSSLALIAIIFVLIGQEKYITKIKDFPLKNSIILCNIICILHLFWFLFIGSDLLLLRYLVVPSFFISFILCIYFSVNDEILKLGNVFKKFLILTIIIIIYGKVWLISEVYTYNDNVSDKNSSYEASSDRVIKTLEDFQKNGYSIYSCGGSFTMEFLLKGRANFINCKDLRKKPSKAIYFDEFYARNNTVITTSYEFDRARGYFHADVKSIKPDIHNCNGSVLYKDRFFVIKNCTE